MRKRLENTMKGQRREYTLSSVVGNPYYTADDEDIKENIYEEDEEKHVKVRIDRKMLWTLESKLTNVLKRAQEIYEENIMNKKKFEKVKVLKFSEILRSSITELLTLGIGIRPKDTSSTATSPSSEWASHTSSSLYFKPCTPAISTIIPSLKSQIW
jgi:hypothetical protein